MIREISVAAASIVALLLAGQAQAGTLTNGAWTPSGCGPEPAVPSIDVSSEKAFNTSLNAEEDFEKKIGIYDDCAIKEANTDASAVSAAANGLKQHAHDAEAKLQSAIDAGMDQYAKKKK